MSGAAVGLGSGNYDVAVGDIEAASSYSLAGGKKFQAATSDVQAFGNG
jgi:hypothetical protein